MAEFAIRIIVLAEPISNESYVLHDVRRTIVVLLVIKYIKL